MMRRINTCLFLITSLTSASVWSQAAVEVAAALSDEYSATLTVPGTVVSVNDARIAAEVTGRVTWIADVGTKISEGDAIAVVDDQELQLILGDNQAQIDSLKAQLIFQQANAERLTRLAGQNNAAANQLDQAKSQLEITRQDLNRAKIALEQTQRLIRKSNVVAPFSGYITERLIQVGEFVNPGAGVARLVDTDNREIRVQAPLQVAEYVASGMPVAISHPGQNAISSIRAVIPIGDERSRMFELRINVDEAAWIIGSAVQVALPNSKPRALVAIPRDALVLRGQETYVYRLTQENTAERVDVQVGIGLGDRVEVIGDIAAGDQLITRGAERLQPGQEITILQNAS